MSMVIGFDPGKKAFGYAVLEEDEVEAGRFSIDQPDKGWRYQQVRSSLEWLDQEVEDVVAIAVEMVPMVHNVQTFRELVEVAGYLQEHSHELWPDAVQIHLPVPEWKRLTVGKGDAKKPAVANWFETTYGMKGVEQDAIDATAIATAGRIVLESVSDGDGNVEADEGGVG